MRILCISDTHGHLSQIDELAEKTNASAVIHAGDFGFYDNESVDRLEARELFLRVVHSGLSQEEKTRAKKLKSDEMRAFIREKLPLSDLGRWLKEGRGFKVPVYAVWGNHEDRVVIEDLLHKKTTVPNLNLIHEGASFRIGPLRLFGLGGNVISQRLADSPNPLAGEGGKIWTTMAQIGQLARTLDDCNDPNETRVFVSHVSPGREAIVEWLAAKLRADVTVSGHMGSPWAVVWSEFSINDAGEANERMLITKEKLQEAMKAPLPEDERLASLVKRARELFATPPEEVFDMRGAQLPSWYRGAFHINLPDAPDGYVVLSCGTRRLFLETFSSGLWLRRA